MPFNPFAVPTGVTGITTAELQAALLAAQREYIARISGTVTSVGAGDVDVTLRSMTTGELEKLIEKLTVALDPTTSNRRVTRTRAIVFTPENRIAEVLPAAEEEEVASEEQFPEVENLVIEIGLDGSYVLLMWDPVTGHSSPEQIHVLRDGEDIGAFDLSEIGYIDTTVVSGQIYTYSVQIYAS